MYAPEIDQLQFRDVLGRYCSGVTVITAMHSSGPVGMTCQSFMSLSLDPPLITFAPAMTSSTYPKIREAQRFAVNILAGHQTDLARTFASPSADRFARVPWFVGDSGAPLLRDSVAHLECEIEAEHVGGDHHLVVGRVRFLTGADRGGPLVFFRRAFGTMQPHDPS